jgi:glutathione-regulated potassium-efflux system protein KefB
MVEGHGLQLAQGVALLAAGVVAAPIFQRLGLGAVLGYLAAGLAIGPFGLGLFEDAESIMHVAELGVVLFLFLIGLEFRPSKLWALRRDIFGLGVTQLSLAALALTLTAMAAGLDPAVAFVSAAGLALSSTAVIMKMMDEKGETATPSGQRNVSILLLEDLAIVPLLALVALIGGLLAGSGMGDGAAVWRSVGLALAAVAAVFVVGRWLLDPLFRLLAQHGGRDVMTAAALLVVLGAAFFMQQGGLSMAMGAFLAGVLLSESAFRNQLEADVEPFRGLLLGLFFMSVGMALDLSVVAQEWRFVLLGVLAVKLIKGAVVFAVARLFRSDPREALRRAALFSQGGEFAFVLYAAAQGAGVLSPDLAASLAAIVILSMALTPLLTLALERLLPPPKVEESFDGIEAADGLNASVLFVGFGRFAQVASQALLARGVNISLIETDVEMIRAAANFGFKVYYGDGERLDVLRASGAATAQAICVCVDKPDVTDRIVALVRAEFPQAQIYARAFDRGHSIRLVQAGVDYQIRETFESALAFSGAVLSGLGVDPISVAEAIEDVRDRDAERFSLQVVGGITAGRSLLRGNMTTPEPEPYVRPQRESKPLNPEAAAAMEDGAP